MFKHHMLHHGGEGLAKFHLRPIKFHKTALSRQLMEAVRIGRLGEGILLNSKSEYSRCRIARLELGEENKTQEVMEMEGQQEMEEQLVRWEGRKQDRWKKKWNRTSMKTTKQKRGMEDDIEKE